MWLIVVPLPAGTPVDTRGVVVNGTAAGADTDGDGEADTDGEVDAEVDGARDGVLTAGVSAVREFNRPIDMWT